MGYKSCTCPQRGQIPCHNRQFLIAYRCSKCYYKRKLLHALMQGTHPALKISLYALSVKVDSVLLLGLHLSDRIHIMLVTNLLVTLS